MTTTTAGETTGLLRAHRAGDLAAFDRLVERLYGELRRVAGRRWRGDRAAATSATGLLHETYLRMRGEEPPDWQDRQHFLAVAARAMRRVLIDSARAALARKRGAGRLPATVEIEELGGDRGEGGETSAAVMIDLERGLEALAALDPRLCRVAECRLFAGLSLPETAAALGLSLRTAERDWQRARAWLRKEMSG